MSVALTTSLTWATHSSCAVGVASMVVFPVLRIVSMQSVIHSDMLFDRYRHVR